jgi:DNA-binding PadR family transcriptional regulator
MDIKYVILGFLSRSSLTGYDLKKIFAESLTLHWSGNNNQIYRTLVDLYQAGLVTKEVEYQESLPARKLYTITERGMVELRQWLLSTPELPQLRHAFLLQLNWADQLSPHELQQVLGNYDEELEAYWLMLCEQRKRDKANTQLTSRQAHFADLIMTRWISFYEDERQWVAQLRRQIRMDED